MTEAQNADDLESLHYKRFLSLEWIFYTVLSLDGTRVIGSLYITPKPCGSHGAVAMYWITTPLRHELEAVFHSETKTWLNAVWGWNTTFYPGPELSDEQRGNAYYLAEAGQCKELNQLAH